MSCGSGEESADSIKSTSLAYKFNYLRKGKVLSMYK